MENMTEVGNRIKLSEIKHITKKLELVDMIKDVFKKGLEGLMIKDLKSTYEPGKRHWLKVTIYIIHFCNSMLSYDTCVNIWFGNNYVFNIVIRGIESVHSHHNYLKQKFSFNFLF